MNHDLYKAYYEYLAKLVLETILPAHFKNMSLQDKPDLINFDGKGVEVTRALFEGDGERTGRFRKVKNKEEHKIDKKDLIRLDQLHSHILFMQGKAAGLVPPAQWCTLAEAEKAFTDKLQKINNYNSIFALFIYAPTFNWYELEMIEDFTQWAANTQKTTKAGFSEVYIFEYTTLYMCHLLTGSVEKIELDKETIHSCCEKALAFANRKLLL